jgi:hypothetical protein
MQRSWAKQQATVVYKCIISRSFSSVTEVVNRYMANPEVNGEPALLDFSSKGALKGGGSTLYAQGHDKIFGGGGGKKQKESQVGKVPKVNAGEEKEI